MRRSDGSASLCFRSLCLRLWASCGALLLPFAPRFSAVLGSAVGGKGFGCVPAFSWHLTETSIPPNSEAVGGGCLSPSGGRPGVTSTLYPSYSLVLSPAIAGSSVCLG